MKFVTSKIKRIFTLLLIFLLSINSFAAVISDNDGTVFITKGEFDEMKNNFQSQIDYYNESLDNKIDGAIAAYLRGKPVAVSYLDFLSKKVNDKDKTFRESWQKLETGAWNNQFMAALGFNRTTDGRIQDFRADNWSTTLNNKFTAVRFNFIGTRYFTSESINLLFPTCYITNDSMSSSTFSPCPSWGASSINPDNHMWTFTDYDSKDIVDPVNSRIYLAPTAALTKYQQTFYIDGVSFKWKDVLAYDAYDQDLHIQYLNNSPGTQQTTLPYGLRRATTTVETVRKPLFAMNEFNTKAPLRNLSSYGAVNMDTTFMCGGKVPETDEVIGLVTAKVNDWTQNDFFTDVIAQRKKVVSVPTAGTATTLGTDNPGCIGTTKWLTGTNTQVKNYYLLNFYWSSTGPQRVTKKCKDLLVNSLSTLMNKEVYYYSGIPLCNVLEEGKVHIKFKLEYDNPAGYTDLKTTIAINDGMFENREFTEIVSGKEYNDGFEYYKTDVTDKNVEIILDYSTEKNPRKELWIKLKPNHGSSGTALSSLATVRMTDVEIFEEATN